MLHGYVGYKDYKKEYEVVIFFDDEFEIATKWIKEKELNKNMYAFVVYFSDDEYVFNQLNAPIILYKEQKTIEQFYDYNLQELKLTMNYQGL